MTDDASGNYQLRNLVPGQYKIEVEKPGFGFARDPITVEVQSAADNRPERSKRRIGGPPH